MNMYSHDVCFFFFFKQKTAYEMRISDWSSDVCSSDLAMTEAPLNLAGRLAKMFITSKLTIVFLLASLLLGTLAVALTPREENPQIVVPGAMVTVALPGATAEEVDRLVVAPLKGVLSEMTGVDHSYGVAQPGVGMVQVPFKVGQPRPERQRE